MIRKKPLRGRNLATSNSDLPENMKKNENPCVSTKGSTDLGAQKIKSSLLTPCRRVGLGRSIKSPTLIHNQVPTTPKSYSHLEMRDHATQLKTPPATSYPSVSQPKRKKIKILSPIKELKYTNQNYLDDLRKRVADKRKKLSSFYEEDPKMKHSCDLQAETVMWRTACQDALTDLLVHVHAEYCNDNKHNMDMPSLLQHLDIPVTLVNYDIDNQQFN